MTDDRSLPAGASLRIVPATVHGRTLVVPPASGAATRWLVGFHGYAQDAGIMLGLLRGVPGSDAWLVASVQALHPFYNRADQVVANWMTRQDRGHAIADNVAYVDAVLAALAREFGPPATLVCAGFSQGVAMAYRAAMRCAPPADAVLAVAGDVPPELRAPGGRRWPRVRIVTGTRDTWYTPARLGGDVDALRAAGADVRATTFDGGHEWTADVDAVAGELLAELPGGA